jgi:zinc protease
VIQIRLRNGLRVLLSPQPASRTASVWVWYRIGSRNEWPGVTGASHWVEHMMFNRSRRYRKGEMDRAISEVGGSLNAFTDYDFTAYLNTVPREHLAIPLDIELDRMTGALFDDREVNRERTVILSEREGNENWPEFRVEEEVYALAYRRHPYRWDALGYPEDIRSMNYEDLSQYYHRYYGTRNAALVVSGGFDLASTQRWIARKFGALRSGGAPTEVPVRDPPIRGERRSTLKGPGTTPFLVQAWRAPDLRDSAAPAMLLLDVLLGGETRMFFAGTAWGPSAEHPSSRLYRHLVETGLAVRAGSSGRPHTDPGLFSIHVQAAEGVPLDRVEEATDAVVERLRTSGPRPAEMEEAREKIRRGAELAYEGTTRTAFRLGYFATLDSLAYEERMFAQLLKTPAAEVQKLAQAMLDPDSRVVVRYEPTGGIRA